MLKRRFAGQTGETDFALRGNNKANVAVIFAIACIPILTAVGCAVDYSLAVRMRSKMQAAADAASVGSISQSSPGYAAAESMTGNGSIAAGVTDATNIFMGNLCGPTAGGCTNVTGYSNLTVTPTVTKTGSTLTSVVTVHRPGADHFSESDRIPDPADFRHLVIERRDVHLSRFLSDAGCFGIDGVAVDLRPKWRNDASLRDQPG